MKKTFLYVYLLLIVIQKKAPVIPRFEQEQEQSYFLPELFLIGLIGVIMFIYHGCDNLKHIFSDFNGRSGIQPIIELVFENVQVFQHF